MAGALLTLVRTNNPLLDLVGPLSESDLDGAKKILEYDSTWDHSLEHRRNARKALVLLEQKRKELFNA